MFDIATLKMMADQGELVGVFDGIPAEAYHGGPGWNKSSLDYLAKSPAHLQAYIQGKIKKDPTPAMIQGQRAHLATLQPDLFLETHMPAPDLSVVPNLLRTQEEMASWLKDRGLKVSGKKEEQKARIRQADPTVKFHDEMLADMVGTKLVLDAAEFESLSRLADNVHKHPEAGPILSIGKAEQSIYAKDPETRLLVKIRPDHMLDNELLVDLKITPDAREHSFARKIVDFRMHVQAAMYLDFTSLATGKRYDRFIFIAVEQQYPFAVQLYELKPDAIEMGRMEYRKNLNLLAECLAKNEWPAYEAKLKQIDLPTFVYTRGIEEYAQA